MAKGISKHIERCHICSSRSPLKSGLCEICEREGFFQSEACKRCESHTTQLFCEVKTTRNLCLKYQDFTEKVDSLIQTEIDLCQDCHVSMKRQRLVKKALVNCLFCSQWRHFFSKAAQNCVFWLWNDFILAKPTQSCVFWPKCFFLE